MPGLRAFAVSLTKNSVAADDLVQETLLKAWRSRQSFQTGSNLEAWLFTILLNTYYTIHRKRAREVEDVDGTHAAMLNLAPAQEDRLNLQDMQKALEQLPRSSARSCCSSSSTTRPMRKPPRSWRARSAR